MSSILADLRSAPVFDLPKSFIAVPRGFFAVAAGSSLSVWSTALYHIRTLYLFTASDYKTVVMPVVVFASVSAPASSVRGFAMAFAWTWLHLIAFNFSNQYRSLAEDRLNKPWRPIPAGRISLAASDRLRWIFCALCLGLSIIGGRDLFLCSIAYLITAIAYDETTLSKHWFGKSVMGTIAYPTCSAGATMLMRGRYELDLATVISVTVLSAVSLTSLHAQDFADVIGDLAMNRTTLPILYPKASRVITCSAVVAWSIFLPIYWHAGFVAAAALISAGTFISWRFWSLRTADDDRLSYVYYNLWLTGTIMLPASARWGSALSA